MKLESVVTTKTGKNISIRTAIPADAKDIVDYLNQVGGESNNLTFGKNEFNMSVEEETDFISSLKKHSSGILLIAIYQKEIISVATLIASRSPRFFHNAELGMSVKKRYWNEGIGTFMMQELMQYANQNKPLKNVQLTVNNDNIHAISLYKKFGFIDVGIVKNAMYVDGKYIDERHMIYYKM